MCHCQKNANFAATNVTIVNSGRIPWLDYVRFFSIFLVILYHTPPRLPLLDEAVILNLRVPVFFCISGFLFNDCRWSRFGSYALHRGRQVLVPYFLFTGFFYLLWLLVGRRLVSEEALTPISVPIIETLMGDPHVVEAPFWYITCLLVMQLIYFWIVRIVSRRWVFVVCVALAVSTYWMSWNWAWVRFWNLGNALLYMPFYALGHCFKPSIERMRFSGWRGSLIMAVVGMGSMWAMTWVMNIKEVNPGLYSLLRVSMGLMVIPLYLCVGKWAASRFGKRKFIERVVLGGTIYLGLQNYVIGFIQIVAERSGGAWLIDHVWMRLVIAVLTMLLIYPVAVWILSHAPWIIGKSRKDNQGLSS